LAIIRYTNLRFTYLLTYFKVIRLFHRTSTARYRYHRHCVCVCVRRLVGGYHRLKTIWGRCRKCLMIRENSWRLSTTSRSVCLSVCLSLSPSLSLSLSVVQFPREYSVVIDTIDVVYQ